MIYFQIENNNKKLIAGNMDLFPRVKEFENNRNFSSVVGGKGIKSVSVIIEDISVWVLVENEEDLLKSSRLFKKTIDLYKTVAIHLWDYQKEQIKAYAHVLNTIQAQMRQKIDDFAREADFAGETYIDSIKNVSTIIDNNKDDVADLICYLQKRIVDMRAHLLGAEVIHLGKHYEVRYSKVSLKRAILNQCTPFIDELDKKSVKLKFYFDDNCEIEVDKNMFSLIVYNFFSNAVKYTKPDSEIRMHYSDVKKNLDISMVSLKMERDEIVNLFNEKTRGKYAKPILGDGIGLFVIQTALALMNKGQMYISPNYDVSYHDDGLIYNENHFQFSL